MSVALSTSHPPPAPSPALRSDASVVRTAFYLQSQGRSLFTWLHQPAGPSLQHGVLICPPIGHEMVHSHRTLRHLANKLASLGFSVLRLDYHGTGDSAGSDLDPARIPTWLANIHDAVNWLRITGGCDKVSLIGLRLGATLAALYAQDHAVENLVLWSPVISGRRYVRELKALSQTARQTADSSLSGIEAIAAVYSEETISFLTQIDLMRTTPRFSHGLILHSELSPKDDTLCNHLAQQGAPVQQSWWPGYEAMMAEPHATVVPAQTLEHVVHWLEAKLTPPSPASQAALPVVKTSFICSPGVRETIHRLSITPDLFGIITQPVEDTNTLPWIVLLNAGAAHRVGPGQLHVQLARRLAALGFHCLRMDLGGLGDSMADSSQAENNAYADTAFRDVSIACDYLQGQHPTRPIVLMGLCSGAYSAFQSAVQLPHPLLIESILLNPLTFFWEDGMSLAKAPTHHLQIWHFYRSRMFDLTSWRRLLTGKTAIGIKGVMRQILTKLILRPKRSKAPALNDHNPATKYGHPAQADLIADLTRLLAANRKIALFTAESDPGHFLLMNQAGRKAKQMIRAGQLQCFTIKDADHIFSTEASRQRLSHALSEYLVGRFGTNRLGE
jgi:alpha-beta hydrolase superfamily lysophospholipase